MTKFSIWSDSSQTRTIKQARVCLSAWLQVPFVRGIAWDKRTIATHRLVILNRVDHLSKWVRVLMLLVRKPVADVDLLSPIVDSRSSIAQALERKLQHRPAPDALVQKHIISGAQSFER
jgi:hypothetical protein